VSHLRHTIRLLLKSPGFTVSAVLILGLGIGVNTAVFSLIQTVVINALPFPDPGQLVHISQRRANDRYWSSISYPDYADIGKSNRSFAELAISDWDFLDFSSEGVPERLTAVYVTASLFQVTKLPFILGRPFTEDEDKKGGPLVVVLSESLWRNRFNADPHIIGKNITLSGRSFQMIGVCSRQVEDISTPPEDPLYVPLHSGPSTDDSWERRDHHDQYCLGRLKPGVSLAEAQAELEVLQRNLAIKYPEAENGYGIRVASLSNMTVSSFAPTAWLLGAAVGCLLLISSANVANLLYARALERQREMSIRSALGASRIRLLSELLLETALLSAASGVVGSLIAWAAVEVTKKISPEDFHRFQEVHLEPDALLFICALTILVAGLSGLFPSLSLSQVNPGSALSNENGRSGTAGPRRQRLRSILVASQVALATLSLIGAGLLVRSFYAAYCLPLGFNAQHLLSANISPTSVKYAKDPSQLLILWNQVLEKARHLPGVTDVAMNSEQPYEWTFGDPNRPFRVAGQAEVEPGKEPTMCGQAISPGYFKTMQIPLLEGRDFDSNDLAGSQQVVIIDQGLAQNWFPAGEAIGKQIFDLRDKTIWTIIGVVQNSRHNRPQNPTAPYQTYFPYHQAEGLFREFLLLRTVGDPAVLIADVRKLVASVDLEVPATAVMTFDDLMSEKFETERLGMFLVTVFSVVALFLAAIGLYGVLAYFVNQRRREIGVRIALGAQGTNILTLVVQQGLTLVAAGLATGIGLALALTRFIESSLYGVSGTDSVTLALASLILGITATFASLLPALRAVRINPITALRE
jgi:putative ABC transport system permease protein